MVRFVLMDYKSRTLESDPRVGTRNFPHWASYMETHSDPNRFAGNKTLTNPLPNLSNPQI